MRVFGEARLIGRMPGPVKCHANMANIVALRMQCRISILAYTRIARLGTARRLVMDQAVLDFAVARTMMVDGQIRPNKVTDPRIIAAMRDVARERFLPPALASLAYVDIEVDLGAGRVLPQPMATARLMQLAELRQGDRVLVIGAGPGYSAALLAACGAVVTALDTIQGIVSTGVTWATGPLAAGWAAGGPYDLILIDGAVAQFPSDLAAQLAPNGRLVGVQVSHGIGRAMHGIAVGGSLRVVAAFDCNAPLLPGLGHIAGFVF